MEIHPPSSTFYPRRLLVRGVNWLGDAVMTTPALMRLRERFPEAHIALLTPEKLRGLWLNHPAVNEVFTFGEGESVFAVGKKLRDGKFDTALVLPNSPRSGIEVYLAGIPKRVGYARPWRNFFLTDKVAPRSNAVKMRKRSEAEIKNLISQTSDANPRTPSSAHQSHEYLHLAAALGANAEPLPALLTVTPQEVDAAKTKFGLQNVGTVFGLNAGAEYGPAKRWPADRFIAAAKEIQIKTNCAWMLFGGKGDLEITNPIESALQGTKVFNMAGKTSLRELMALMKLCSVVLTNDTGPMHMAVALGMPVVAIFGSTSPELTGPISEKARIVKSDAPCSPCFLRECPIDFRCMNGIHVEKVVEEVLTANGHQ
ncbi:MAG TPA: lipopolysaccharide heptosyltransferase II [Verrucomicrobiae bacterium]|jgi:heptosyltransferase-2